jgi:hypothetical protein
VTVRESKRPKARTQDHEYRRSSISPSMRPMLALYPTRESPKREDHGYELRGDAQTTRSGPGTPARGTVHHEGKGGLRESRAWRTTTVQVAHPEVTVGGTWYPRVGVTQRRKSHRWR